MAKDQKEIGLQTEEHRDLLIFVIAMIILLIALATISFLSSYFK